MDTESSSATQTRVYLIEDHPAMRLGLRSLIESEPGFKVCGEAGKALGAIEEIDAIKPDVILLDLKLPDRPGLELIKDIRATGIKTPILVISSWDERLYAKRVLKAEANGYIMKDEALDRVIEGLRRVLTGNVYLTPSMTQYQVNTLSRATASESIDLLTDRELEVLELIGQGKSTQAISNHLKISSKTVDAHRANIKVKLGINDLNELIRFAVQLVENGEVGGEATKR